MKTVLAGAPCGKTPVCDGFYDCFYGLILPEGSKIQRAKGGSVPQNLNALVDIALGDKHDYIFIVEDDSMFAPDSVLRLLAHDKDVVTGLCLARFPPFNPYVYGGLDEEGRILWRKVDNSETGLIKVLATGMGGVLIKTEVFQKLKRPYFEHYFDSKEQEWGQDIVFQKKLIDAGIQVYCDLDVTIWHATHCSLAMLHEDGKWNKNIRIGDQNYKLADGY